VSKNLDGKCSYCKECSNNKQSGYKKKTDQDLNMNRLRIFWINIVRCVVKQNQLKNSGFVDEKKMDIMSIVSNVREN